MAPCGRCRPEGATRRESGAKAPLCKGGCQIADSRQFDWGIVVFTIPPALRATSLYTREAWVLPRHSNHRTAR